MDFAKRLAYAMELAGLPKYGGASQLARAIGTTPQATLQVLKGETKSLTAENTAKAARFLKVNWFWLATGQGQPRPHSEAKADAVAARFAALHPNAQEQLLTILRELEIKG